MKQSALLCPLRDHCHWLLLENWSGRKLVKTWRNSPSFCAVHFPQLGSQQFLCSNLVYFCTVCLSWHISHPSRIWVLHPPGEATLSPTGSCLTPPVGDCVTADCCTQVPRSGCRIDIRLFLGGFSSRSKH